MHFYSLRQLRNSLFNLFKQTNYNNIGILLKNNAVSVNLSKKIVSQPGIGSGSRKFIQLRKALLNWYITIEFMKMRKKYLQQGLIFLGKSNLKMSYICNHKQFLLILLQMGRNLKCLLIFSNFHHFHGRPEKKARDKRNYNFRPKDPTSDLAILWHTICPNNVAATSLNLRKFKYIILRLFLAQYSCSRPQCTYSGIFSPNKKWFFNFFQLFQKKKKKKKVVKAILCNFSMRLLKYF